MEWGVDVLSHSMEAGRVIVVGRARADSMAAGRAGGERRQSPPAGKDRWSGKEDLISGKSAATDERPDLDDFISMYGPNGRFLHTPFAAFFGKISSAFLGLTGFETKVERGGRIFPFPMTRRMCCGLRRHLKRSSRESTDGVPVRGSTCEWPHRRSPDGKRTLCRSCGHPGDGGAPGRRPALPATDIGWRLPSGISVTKLRPALVPLVVAEVERANRRCRG